jgi:hypothetical protein
MTVVENEVTTQKIKIPERDYTLAANMYLPANFDKEANMLQPSWFI